MYILTLPEISEYAIYSRRISFILHFFFAESVDSLPTLYHKFALITYIISSNLYKGSMLLINRQVSRTGQKVWESICISANYYTYLNLRCIPNYLEWHDKAYSTTQPIEFSKQSLNYNITMNKEFKYRKRPFKSPPGGFCGTVIDRTIKPRQF